MPSAPRSTGIDELIDPGDHPSARTQHSVVSQRRQRVLLPRRRRSAGEHADGYREDFGPDMRNRDSGSGTTYPGSMHTPRKAHTHMAVLGTVFLLAFGFDSQGSLPPTVIDRLHSLRGRGGIRLLDALYVSRSVRGMLTPGHGSHGRRRQLGSARVDLVAVARRQRERNHSPCTARAPQLVRDRLGSRGGREPRLPDRPRHLRAARPRRGALGN